MAKLITVDLVYRDVSASTNTIILKIYQAQLFLKLSQICCDGVQRDKENNSLNQLFILFFFIPALL